MKILYLCTDTGIPVLANTGGAAVHIQGLIAAFHRFGHSITLTAPLLHTSLSEPQAKISADLVHLPPQPDLDHASDSLKAYYEILGAPARALQRPENPWELDEILYNIYAHRMLKEIHRKEPPDFIYERASLFGIVGGALAHDWRIPLILELNNPLALEQEIYWTDKPTLAARQAEQWSLNKADAVLPVSSSLRDYVIAAGVVPEKVVLVPNGIDLSLFAANHPPGSSMVPPDKGPKRTIGFLGGLRPWHGVTALPNLLEGLLPRHPELSLLIVGDGPLRGKLEADLQARGLNGKVRFTGAVPHEAVPALIRQIDIGLLPYPPLDHFFYFSPLKLFEYMACGVAVVGPALGQIKEVIRHGQTGLLYEPGNPGELLRACERLLADEPLRVRLGRAAAVEVRASYSWDKNAARVIELARTILDVRR